MAENISKLLEDWYARPVGQVAFQQINESICKSLEHIFGYHLVQLGLARGMPLYLQSTIPTRILLSNTGGELVKLVANFEELPIASDCTDAIIGHHFLEFSRHPHRTLREIHRILTPQGHLILIGFNPYSLLGLGQLCLKLSGVRLWKNWSPIRSTRLRDWLYLLGFEIISYDTLCHIPKLGSDNIHHILCNLDNIVKRTKLPVGGLFVIHAIKSVSGVSSLVRKEVKRRSIISVPTPSPNAGTVILNRTY